MTGLAFEQDVNIVGLQAAYLSESELKWTSIYGMTNFNTKEAVTDSTLFMIGLLFKARNGSVPDDVL